MTDATIDSIDNLLDMELDDLQDMPEFAPYPNGAHKVTLKWKTEPVNKHPAVTLTMIAIETVELENPEVDKPLEPKAETQVLYMLDNEFGQGSLKEVLKPLGAALGISNTRAIIEGSEGMEVLVVTKQRMNKEKTQSYTGIKNLQVV